MIGIASSPNSMCPIVTDSRTNCLDEWLTVILTYLCSDPQSHLKTLSSTWTVNLICQNFFFVEYIPLTKRFDSFVSRKLEKDNLMDNTGLWLRRTGPNNVLIVMQLYRKQNWSITNNSYQILNKLNTLYHWLIISCCLTYFHHKLL